MPISSSTSFNSTEPRRPAPALDFLIEDVYRKAFSGSENELMEHLNSTLSVGGVAWVSFVYFAALEMTGWYAGHPEAKYQESLAQADFVLADGIAFRLLHFAFHQPQLSGLNILLRNRKYSAQAVPNLNGTDLSPKILDSLQGKNVRVVLYGATPDVFAKAIEHIRQRHGLTAQGAHGFAPFPHELLEGRDPVLLLVGLGTPKQEQWILENQARFKERGSVIVMGVGGLFDFWAGVEQRAPEVIRRSGLEWLWRFVTLPRKNARKAAASLKFFKHLLVSPRRRTG